MKDGIVFLWIEKELIAEIIKIMEQKDFYFIESLCWVMLDETKRHEVEATCSININPAIVRNDSAYIKSSKKTMLMFRRYSVLKKNPLKLKNQRSCDFVSDWVRQDQPNYKPNQYIYQMIETMLPESQN